VWRLHVCRPERIPVWYGDDPVLAGLPTLPVFAEASGTRPGQEFLIRSDGRVVAEVNAFLASPRMTSRSAGTRDKYGRGLGTWLGYLDAVGRSWAEAGEADVDGFKFWRMTDGSNPSRVAGATVLDNLSAVNAFYEWAQPRYGTVNPVARRHLHPRRGTDRLEPFAATPHVVRQRDVKWLDPGGYACWRDLGLRGLDRSGREVDRWRGRNSQRDCAFADGLYGTGLRLAEWSSVLLVELPPDDPTRGYATCWLASECGKGRRGRRYWMPRSVLTGVLAYCEGERAAAIRRAQLAGRYDRVQDPHVLTRALGRRRVELADRTGNTTSVSLDSLAPQDRRRIFTQGPHGLVPAALWLNEDGLPREAHGWQHTFDTANQRVARAGLTSVAVTAHMLRHSFALRWFAVGRLLYEKRFAHLDAEELRDFRAQFGDTWYLVKTLLGHASVTTTMDVYLEPFRDLDVSLLIEHAHGAAMSALLAEMFAAHPQVITAPDAQEQP
jgi:site-specific recombinase XerD